MKNLVIEKPYDSAIGPTFDPRLLTTDPLGFNEVLLKSIIRLFNRSPYWIQRMLPEEYRLTIRGGKISECAEEWKLTIEDVLNKDKEGRKTEPSFPLTTLNAYFDYGSFTLEAEWRAKEGLTPLERLEGERKGKISEACHRANVPRKIIYVDENGKKASAEIRGNSDSSIIFETHIEDVSEGDVIPMDSVSSLPEVLLAREESRLKEREIYERFFSAFSRLFPEEYPTFDFYIWREIYPIPAGKGEELSDLSSLQDTIDWYINDSIYKDIFIKFECEDEVRNSNLEENVKALKSRIHLAFKQIYTFLIECISEGRDVPKVSKIIRKKFEKIYQQDYGDGKTYRKSPPEKKLETAEKVVRMVEDTALLLNCRYYDPIKLLERVEAYNI